MLRLISFLFPIIISSLCLVGHASGGDNIDSTPELSRNVASALEHGKEAAKTMTLPVNKYTEEESKKAKETSKVFHSTAFQGKVEKEKRRLEKEVFGECIASWKKKKERQEAEKNKPASSLGEKEKVYLFISSSMPDETVHNYLVDIAGSGDPRLVPVMRGMVNGLADKKATTKYFSRILKENQDCRDDPQKPCKRFKTDILFLPPLFAEYGIDQVPAVIYDDGNKNVFLIQGDAGLDYLLERINREAKQKSLESLINKIRGREK